MGGSKYFVTFLDDFSRKIWAYFMKEKSEVLFKVKKGKSKVGNLEGRKIKYLRSNGGSEYRMKGFLQFYKDEITRCITVKDNIQENEVARRMKKTLFERERGMRLHAGLPNTFWKEAVNHACYLANRSSSKVLDFKCAEEVWSGELAGSSNLRMFGSSAYAHISSNEQTKLKPNFLGVEKKVKGYKLWNVVSKKRVLSRYVINDEKIKPFNEVKTSEVKKKTDVDVIDEATEVPLTKVIMEETPAQVEQLALLTYDSVRQLLEQEFQRSIALDKYALSFSPRDTTTYQEAIAKYIRESWMGAMLEQKKKSIPKEGNLVGCKRVYRKKEGMHDKETMRFKARVLAKEYSHKEKVNYDHISPAKRCVYHHVFKDSIVLLSSDVLTTCQDVSRIPKLKTQLRREFDMEGLEAAQQILEVKFSVQGGSSTVELDEMMQVSYARVVGCLMARIFKRPSLTQGLSIVSKCVVNPGRRHWQAATWILYYLRNTKEHEFLFERQQEQACIAGHERLDLAGDLGKGRSVISNVLTCSKGSGSCRTTMESVEILSTTEVDCMAVTEASAKALWLNDEGWVSSGKITTEEEAQSTENVSDCLTRTIAMEKLKHCLDLLSVTAC
ncbi:hypothetical protein ACLB2K_014201 [Fragaria x ananassa]